jgi:hypothetical protein
MTIEEVLFVEHVKTFRSKSGREVLGLLVGHLGDNKRGTTFLLFPDPDDPATPYWWYGVESDGDLKRGDMEIEMLGELNFKKGCSLVVELDYEEKARAVRLKIISAQGIAFLSECEGIIPKWIG